MKKLITFVLLFYAINSYSVFSAFEIINPNNQNEHGFSVEITEYKKNNKTYYEVNITKINGDKTFWVIETIKRLNDSDLNFRNYIWEGKDPSKNIYSKIKLDKSNANNNTVKITTSILKEKINRTFIYMDFSSMVFDGGFYYTIDLNSYISRNTNL